MRADFQLILAAAFTVVPVTQSARCGEIDSDEDIAPIFQMHCIRCHGPANQHGGLRFDSAAGALRKGDSDEDPVVPGNPGASEIIRWVTSDDEFTRMPPEGERLSDVEIKLLNRSRSSY